MYDYIKCPKSDPLGLTLIGSLVKEVRKNFENIFF